MSPWGSLQEHLDCEALRWGLRLFIWASAPGVVGPRWVALPQLLILLHPHSQTTLTSETFSLLQDLFPLGPTFISDPYCAKFPQAPGLKCCKYNYLTVLEVRNPGSISGLKSSVGRTVFLLEAKGENLFPCLPLLLLATVCMGSHLTGSLLLLSWLLLWPHASFL